MYEFLYSVFEWIEWASDSTVHSDGLTCFISIDSATLNESFDMNDSLSNLLKQGLAVTYWRFYCHIWQLLVQSLVISRLDYCNAPLAGLPNTIKPLQMIQNAVARLVFNEPKRAHVTPLLSPCTGYQLQLASSSRHWCLHIEQPQAQHPPTSTHYYESSLPEVWDLLVSDASWYHHREAQNHSPEHSRSPFLAGGMIFPPPSGLLDPCQSSSNNWKLISFDTTWLHPKLYNKKGKNNRSLYLLPLIACTYLNNAWDLVLRALPLSVCFFKMNRFMYSPIVSSFG